MSRPHHDSPDEDAEDQPPANKLPKLTHKFSYDVNDERVVIHDGVQAVDTKLVRELRRLTTNVKEVVFGKDVEEIESWAFVNMNSLQVIRFNDALERISEFCFQGCEKLEQVEFGANLKTIAWSAFKECKALTRLRFNDALEQIGPAAFYDCGNLREIEFGANLKSIERSAFHQCSSLVNLALGDNLERIGRSAFERCLALREVECGANLRIIQESAFHHCVALRSVRFKDALEQLGDAAFDFCTGVEEIQFGASFKTFGRDWFPEYYPDNLEVRYSGGDLCVALRLNVQFPENTPELTSQRLFSLFVNRPINKWDLIATVPLQQSTDVVAKEKTKLKEIQEEYPGAFKSLLPWLVTLGVFG